MGRCACAVAAAPPPPPPEQELVEDKASPVLNPSMDFAKFNKFKKPAGLAKTAPTAEGEGEKPSGDAPGSPDAPGTASAVVKPLMPATARPPLMKAFTDSSAVKSGAVVAGGAPGASAGANPMFAHKNRVVTEKKVFQAREKPAQSLDVVIADSTVGSFSGVRTTAMVVDVGVDVVVRLRQRTRFI